MAKKNNIRSIRFSDELADLIDRQVGKNFSEKFENLVTRCVWELPQTETRLKDLEERITEKRTELQTLNAKVRNLENTLFELGSRVGAVRNTIDRTLKEWES